MRSKELELSLVTYNYMAYFENTVLRALASNLEISEGVILDYDENGRLVGINIDNASKKVSLKELTLNKLPIDVQTIAA
jgi:uncharacterized protein YuzE